MSSAFVSSLQEQVKSDERLAALLTKRQQVCEKAMADIGALDEKIEELMSGNGQAQSKSSAAPKKRKAAKASKPGEIKTFKEGGRGRRQCPKCEVYVGVRSTLCVCGYNFDTKRGGGGQSPQKTTPKKTAAKSTRGRQEGDSNEDRVVALLKDNPDGVRLKEATTIYLKKYGKAGGIKEASVASMISGILKKLGEQGLVTKDDEHRHKWGKKPAPKKKPAAKRKSAKKKSAA
jgi:hypothetical protein